MVYVIGIVTLISLLTNASGITKTNEGSKVDLLERDRILQEADDDDLLGGGGSVPPKDRPYELWKITPSPSSEPSFSPSVKPSHTPSSAPSESPTSEPTFIPTTVPSFSPTSVPTEVHSLSPSGHPSTSPSHSPSSKPSTSPSFFPSQTPTSDPTSAPSLKPSIKPTSEPSGSPSSVPSNKPSQVPSMAPSTSPTVMHSSEPSNLPSSVPSTLPTVMHSSKPSSTPSMSPSNTPTIEPTFIPTLEHSNRPSAIPSTSPSSTPTLFPTNVPTLTPTLLPTNEPTVEHSNIPSTLPSVEPSTSPSSSPSNEPSVEPTLNPSFFPTSTPSTTPSAKPSIKPSLKPSNSPTVDLCPPVSQGLFGSRSIDSSVLFFSYIIEKDIKTTLSGIENEILPEIELGLLQSILPEIFEGCAIEASRVNDPNRRKLMTGLVGMDMNPRDDVTAESPCGVNSCFMIQGKITLYYAAEVDQTQINSNVLYAITSSLNGNKLTDTKSATFIETRFNSGGQIEQSDVQPQQKFTSIILIAGGGVLAMTIIALGTRHYIHRRQHNGNGYAANGTVDEQVKDKYIDAEVCYPSKLVANETSHGLYNGCSVPVVATPTYISSPYGDAPPLRVEVISTNQNSQQPQTNMDRKFSTMEFDNSPKARESAPSTTTSRTLDSDNHASRQTVQLPDFEDIPISVSNHLMDLSDDEVRNLFQIDSKVHRTSKADEGCQESGPTAKKQESSSHSSKNDRSNSKERAFFGSNFSPAENDKIDNNAAYEITHTSSRLSEETDYLTACEDESIIRYIQETRDAAETLNVSSCIMDIETIVESVKSSEDSACDQTVNKEGNVIATTDESTLINPEREDHEKPITKSVVEEVSSIKDSQSITASTEKSDVVDVVVEPDVSEAIKEKEDQSTTKSVVEEVSSIKDSQSITASTEKSDVVDVVVESDTKSGDENADSSSNSKMDSNVKLQKSTPVHEESSKSVSEPNTSTECENVESELQGPASNQVNEGCLIKKSADNIVNDSIENNLLHKYGMTVDEIEFNGDDDQTRISTYQDDEMFSVVTNRKRDTNIYNLVSPKVDACLPKNKTFESEKRKSSASHVTEANSIIIEGQQLVEQDIESASKTSRGGAQEDTTLDKTDQLGNMASQTETNKSIHTNVNVDSQEDVGAPVPWDEVTIHKNTELESKAMKLNERQKPRKVSRSKEPPPIRTIICHGDESEKSHSKKQNKSTKFDMSPPWEIIIESPEIRSGFDSPRPIPGKKKQTSALRKDTKTQRNNGRQPINDPSTEGTGTSFDINSQMGEI